MNKLVETLNPLVEIRKLGQQVWMDNLSRTLIQEGALARFIEEDALAGVTSNPSIFYNAISKSPYYKEELAKLKTSSLTPEQRYESLVIPDIQAACNLMRPVYDRSGGDAGYVSLEVSPRLAYDEAGTISAAFRLAYRVKRENLLIKVPGTPEGVRVFEYLISQGLSVNVTLMFSLTHVDSVLNAYIRGLRKFAEGGGNISKVKAVASVFLSRVDTLVDKKLEANGAKDALDLRGRAAVAMCKQAYQKYKELFHGPAFADLKAKGGRPQYLLWASTGTKNPAYSDLLYVDSLIGPETVNTMPDATLAATKDHAKPGNTVEQNLKEARQCFDQLKKNGIDMHDVGEQLQIEGVKLFDDSFNKLMELTA